MRIPIAYALGWPERIAHRRARLDLLRAGRAGLRAARSGPLPGAAAGPRCLAAGGAAPYSSECRQRGGGGGISGGRIGFLDIAVRGTRAGSGWRTFRVDDLDSVLAYDAEARRVAARCLARHAGLTPGQMKDLSAPCSRSMDAISDPVPGRAARSSCSCTSSGTTGSRAAMACGSRCSRSASAPSCSAGPTGTAPAGRSAPMPLGGYVKMLGDADAASAHGATRPMRGIPKFPEQERGQRMAIVAAGPIGQFPVRDRRADDPVRAVGQPFTPAGSRLGPARQPGGGRRAAAGRPDHRGRRPADRQLRGAADRRASTARARPLRSSIERERRDRSTHGDADRSGRYRPLRNPAAGLADRRQPAGRGVSPQQSVPGAVRGDC